jgi:hypothetical protein
MAPSPDAPEGHPPAPTRVRGSEALRLHLTLAASLALCAGAFWFELGRALGGNALSWAYVFEWPLLGVFAVYMWWKFLHPDAQKVSSGSATLDPSFETMRLRWEESQRELERSRRDDGAPPPN